MEVVSLAMAEVIHFRSDDLIRNDYVSKNHVCAGRIVSSTRCGIAMQNFQHCLHFNPWCPYKGSSKPSTGALPSLPIESKDDGM